MLLVYLQLTGIMDPLRNKQNLKLKSITKLVKSQSFVGKCCKMPAKNTALRILSYFCITRPKLIPVFRYGYRFRPRNTKFANFAGLYFPYCTTFRKRNFGILLIL